MERDGQRQEARFVEDVLRKEYDKMLAFLATQRCQLCAWTLNMGVAFVVGIVLPIALVSLSDVWDWYAARLTFSCPQLPGTTWESNRAYVNYIRRLQRGQGGFTCFASLQMPRG
ncbi:MAG: hypothetical protein EOO78_36045 [Oxalobacteraceae bacterium]|nr:MAG: hypothetical protein EOO78_36045 [Oxalobacteraceae bacterium]